MNESGWLIKVRRHMGRIIKGRDPWNNDRIYWEEISAEEYQKLLLNPSFTHTDYSYAYDQDTGRPVFMKRYYGEVELKY